MTRLLLGVSVSSGLEGVDTALVRLHGVGLNLQPHVERHHRTLFLPHIRDALRRNEPLPPREIGELLATSARHLLTKLGLDFRAILLLGLQLPPLPNIDLLGEFLAEFTGLTIWTRMAARDVAAGGVGHPLTPLADYLLVRNDLEDRLLIHLGHVSSVLFVPSDAKLTNLVAFDAGPGGRLLDDIIWHGSREKERCDSGGNKAVQGMASEAMLAEGMRLACLQRKLPRQLSASEFGGPFLTEAFEAARRDHATLADLLCTATHYVARCIGESCRHFVPTSQHPRRIFLSGGGVRNGFLWKLLQQQFPGEELHRSDEVGVPTLGRTAVATAMLAGLTLDGVTGNLPLLTGASGGRLLGRFIPGDPRNWGAVTAWAAEQMWDYTQFPRAA
jgi:anhydro-N-acetylmuramic acid kinase